MDFGNSVKSQQEILKLNALFSVAVVIWGWSISDALMLLMLFVFFDASFYIFTKIRSAIGWFLMLLKKVSLLKVLELIFKDSMTQALGRKEMNIYQMPAMSGTVYIVYVITFSAHSSSVTKVVVFISGKLRLRFGEFK